MKGENCLDYHIIAKYPDFKLYIPLPVANSEDIICKSGTAVATHTVLTIVFALINIFFARTEFHLAEGTLREPN